MERQIQERYHEGILRETMRRYGIGPDQIRALDAYESFIYAFERADGSYILRISHSLRRSEALIAGEVDWIDYLSSAEGVSVARAIVSQAGKLVEAIDDGQGGQFLATAFVRAWGQPPGGRWTPALYAEFGRSLGRMHALAVSYQPAQPTWRRPAWDDVSLNYPARFLPAAESAALGKYQALCEHVRMLPTDPHSYGLTHFDAHGGNCLVDEAGRLTFFDFDDCTYTWYANDLAIAISNLARGTSDPAAVVGHLLRGYRRAYPLERRWLREILVFQKMLEIFDYAVFHRDHDVTHLGAESERYMHALKYNIEHDVPTFAFDFEAFAAEET